MKKTCLQAGFTLLAGALAIVSVVQLGNQADARQPYFKAFVAKYPDFKGADGKCNICHKGTEKKNRNDYGAAVGKALGAKNVKDVDAINTALDTAAKDPSPVDGKTFGDLIKDGTLPITK
jgi:hypothetical protein